jgi:hypothetical protein
MEINRIKEAPSLVELSAKRLLHRIRFSSSPVDFFISLEPRFQHIIFRKVCSIIIQLHKVMRKWNDPENIRSWRNRSFSLRNLINCSEWENDDVTHFPPKNTELERVPASEGWHIDVAGLNNRPAIWNYLDFTTQWGNDDLRLTPFYRGLKSSVGIDSREGMPLWLTTPRFPRVISSELLVYRLRRVFEISQSKDIGDIGTAWSMRLKHEDGKSFFNLRDDQGSPDVCYFGTEETSLKALKLLSYLVGIDFMLKPGVCSGTKDDEMDS